MRGGLPMTDSEKNKQTVLSYYSLAFNEKRPAEAVARYVGSKYIQHNRRPPMGPRLSSSS